MTTPSLNASLPYGSVVVPYAPPCSRRQRLTRAFSQTGPKWFPSVIGLTYWSSFCEGNRSHLCSLFLWELYAAAGVVDSRSRKYSRIDSFSNNRHARAHAGAITECASRKCPLCYRPRWKCGCIPPGRLTRASYLQNSTSSGVEITPRFDLRTATSVTDVSRFLAAGLYGEAACFSPVRRRVAPGLDVDPHTQPSLTHGAYRGACYRQACGSGGNGFTRPTVPLNSQPVIHFTADKSRARIWGSQRRASFFEVPALGAFAQSVSDSRSSPPPIGGQLARPASSRPCPSAPARGALLSNKVTQ